MGRKAGDDPRNKMCTVRLTQLERETLDVYAGRHSKTASEVLKEGLLDYILRDDDTAFYYEHRGPILERKRAEAKERAKEEARKAERLKWEAERESQKQSNL